MLTRRFILVLVLLSAAAFAAAAGLTWQRWHETIRSVDAEPAFPGIGERLEDVTTIRIERAADNPDGSLTITRAADHWTVAEKDGYRTRPAAVRELLLGLADLELIDARTRTPARYHRLHLSDTDTPGSRATRIVLEDATGAVLIDALFGKPVPSLSGDTPSMYMRRSGDAQSWLASGELRIRGGHLDWVPIVLARIERTRIALARLSPPGADPLELSWDNRTRQFRIRDLPDDREIASNYELLQVGMLAETMVLDDVRSAEGLTPDPELGGATWRTIDGLVLTLALAPGSGNDPVPWALFAVDTAPDTEQKVLDEAAGIRERTEGWAFRLPERAFARLRSTRDSLTRPKR